VDYTVATQSDGSDLISGSVTRDWTVAGYVDTSHGRITTSVVRHSDYSNSDDVAQAGAVQTVKQQDSGWTETTTADGPGLGNRQIRHDAWSYPISMVSTYIPGATSDSYTVDGQVSVARHLTSTETEHGNAWKPVSSVDDAVRAQGTLQRVNGVVTAADGSDSELYVGVDRGGCYGHFIAADHGYVTQDLMTGCS
jgi:hypothetical protein